MIITEEEHEECMENLQGWEFLAWRAFHSMNSQRKVYDKFDRSKKVYCRSELYNYIYSAKNASTPNFIEASIFRGEGKGSCVDHPFSARVAYDAIMSHNQYLLDDFNTFRDIFWWLATSLLTVSKDMNQRVKYKKDKNGNEGELITSAVIEERYRKEDGSELRFWDVSAKDYVDGFPLPIMPWYREYEKTLVRKN
tara:strand:- start:294 stop:878 length:585 start_codon:yes stop_codon:yes gene_type:complete